MSKKVCGIFIVHGIRNENKVRLEHIENVELLPHEFINDTLVTNINISSGIRGEIYKCNITDLFIMQSKKLPVSYINVIYERPLRKIILFRVHLFFIIETEIKSSKQLLENLIDGRFVLEISIDSVSKELNDTIDKFPGNKRIYSKFNDFVLSSEMKAYSEMLAQEVDLKIKKQYAAELEYFKAPTNILSLKDYKFDD